MAEAGKIVIRDRKLANGLLEILMTKSKSLHIIL